MMGVRGYDKKDREAIQNICYLTGYMGDSAECFWRHKHSFVEVWTSYYINQEPESLYVATIDDVVVGYLTGCIDTSLAPKDYEIYYPIIKHGLLFRPGTAGFFWRGIIDSIKDRKIAKAEFIDERWPSHLHINLLPVARGRGLGYALMERWLKHLRDSRSPGCHLSTIFENTGAVLFFERMGFKCYGEPSLIQGMRGLDGGRLHQQIMVWTAEHNKF
jgi:ribosomal protein S18 acetylase RimI-like enzyme